jgi:CRISPR-associated endonuclease/helicase Cas3
MSRGEPTDYSGFFAAATAHRPFRFQERFRSEPGQRTTLKAPTGLGKTDTVLIAWLHRRATEPESTPRRLLWCLPGRALTEQVARGAEECVKRLVGAGLIAPTPVYRLLGGSEDNKLTARPDETAIMVGTQDILLSRALNRGYARKPFRWPIDFALLNNDCLWVLDEVQLLGDGLATSTQLAAFRERFGTFGPAESCWISATFDPEWLATVDFAGSSRVIEPDAEDSENETVKQRIHAGKRVEQAQAACRLPGGTAEFVAAEHRAGTLSLVIANTVRRAVEIRRELEKRTGADVRLLHSRFRAADRKEHLDAVLSDVPEAGRIAVATQVIEAGIDLDASLMVTDLAPYASMVQRFGRVNRKGERAGCRIYWVGRPLTAKRKPWAEQVELKAKEFEEVCAPYEVEEVQESARVLAGLTSASPADLPKLVPTPEPWKHVLRRADLLDLFDTSTDLDGNEIDISRFVRSDPDRDVYVAWRDWQGDTPPDNMPEIDEGELCPAPIGDFDKIAAKVAWCWNSATGKWARPDPVYPGLTLLMHVKEGKYTKDYGWSPDSKSAVTSLAKPGREIEANNADPNTFTRYKQSLADHTQQVFEEMGRLLEALEPTGVGLHRAALESASRNHDWGKAHPVMQATLHQGKAGPYEDILAKSKERRTHSRPYFRHELASALAMLAAGECDLAAYVVAAHHGRVRVSMRSMPGERDTGGVCVRGVREGESLLECSLGAGVDRAANTLTLGPVTLGSGSWTGRALRLRDELGPFRLAYLEMLLRAADEAASAKGDQ